MTNKKLNYPAIAKEMAILTGAVAIIAAAVYFFLVPSHTSVSSISGLGIVLSNFVPLPLSAITMVLNIVLLIIGFFTCGREFGAKTVYTSVMLPVFLGLFERLFPDFGSMTDSQELDVLCYILVVSVGLSILFNRNASSGGLDIVAKIMNKYLHMDLGKSIIIAGLVTVASSYFAYDLQTVIIGALSTYLSGLVLDYFIDEFTGKIRVCVISEHNDDFKRYVIETLQRGITVYTATGGYSDAQKEEILAILTKKEYGQFMDYVQTKDPNAFVTISNVKRVVGSWNTPKRRTYF